MKHLIDRLEIAQGNNNADELIPEAITMLRKQQAEIEALKEKLELTVPKDSQDWKGMDGATAFWLIERHSNHWGDAKLMMEEWRDANTHPVKEPCKGCGGEGAVGNILDTVECPFCHGSGIEITHPVNVTYELTMEKCHQQQAEIEALKIKFAEAIDAEKDRRFE